MSAYRNVRRLLCASAALLALTSLGHADNQARPTPTRTPIKHMVVIFGENQTFDRYFATYPNAANIPGEQSWVGIPASEFHARPNTPKVNGLTPTLLHNNPNASLTGAQANPQRLGPAEGVTCDMNHGYTAEQRAADGGLMDRFVQSTSSTAEGCQLDGSTVMNYFDGNSVTALWNYAQHYAMSDAFFGTTYGPSVPGHINLVSANTRGLILHGATSDSGVFMNPVDGSQTLINDLPGFLDDCATGVSVEMTGRNIGDLLNAKNVTWGWFAGGFAPTQPAVLNPDGSTKTPAVCGTSHTLHQYTLNKKTFVVPNPTVNFTVDVHMPAPDYSKGDNGFMLYASTRNPHHLPPSSVAAIGKTDQANHHYDISYLSEVLKAGNLPSVIYIKPPHYANGHPGYSDPLVSQADLVQTINAIMSSPEWESTAIVLNWDDSDGWYDHVYPPVLQPSNTALDFHCGNGQPAPGDGFARCGLGPRIPFLVLSPWAKRNYVDHTVINWGSLLLFIEQNWGLGFIDGPVAPPRGTGSFDRYSNSLEGLFDFEREPDLRPLILDPIHGTVVNENGDAQNQQGQN
jgi:phospholipase C